MNKSKQARSISSDLHFYSSLQFEQAVSVIDGLTARQSGGTGAESSSDIYYFVVRSKHVMCEGTIRRWGGTHSEISCNVSLESHQTLIDFLSFSLWIFLPVLVDQMDNLTGYILFAALIGVTPFVISYQVRQNKRQNAHREKDTLFQMLITRFKAVGQVTYDGAALIDVPTVEMDSEMPKLKHDER